LNIHQKLDYSRFGILLDYKYHLYMINNFKGKLCILVLELERLVLRKLAKQCQIQAHIAKCICLLN